MKTKCSILAVLCLLCSGAGFAQSQLFDKYAEIEGVTSVYVSKAMFDMMPAVGDIGLSLMNMKGKAESLHLVSTEQKEQILRMREDFTRLVGRHHKELMRVRDGKTRTTFYADLTDDRVKELLMLADTDSSFTVIRLLGNFTLKDVQDIAGEMGK
jgi:hypothetical protein